MERDETELARVRRGARHEHPTRFEQRPELLVGGPLTRDRAGTVEPCAELDQTVDGDQLTRCLHDQRVDVDAGDVVTLGDEPSEADQQGDQLRPVDRSLAAERTEQLLGGQVVDHSRRGHGVERSRPEHDVGDRLGQHATDAEHHGRTELRVADHARDQFPVAGDHRCDQQRHVAIVGAGRREQVVGSLVHRRSVAETEPHEAPLGLVGDPIAVQLDDDGKAEFDGGVDGLGRIGHDTLGGDRHAEVGEQRLGVALRQRRGRGRSG